MHEYDEYEYHYAVACFRGMSLEFANLEDMISLQYIDLSDNRLKRVKGLNKLENVKVLKLSGNPAVG